MQDGEGAKVARDTQVFTSALRNMHLGGWMEAAVPYDGKMVRQWEAALTQLVRSQGEKQDS